MTDRIYLDEFHVQCRVGISAAERRKPQEVIVGVSLFLDLSEAAAKDSLSETLDYRRIRAEVSRVVSRGEFNLIESLADAIASAMLGSFKVDKVVVNVRKAKYSESPAIGVELDRKAS